MKCRIIDLAILVGGKQRLTLELEGDFRSQFDELHDQDCDVALKKFRYKRSLDANSYAWLLIDKIARAKRLPKKEVYRNAIKEIGGVSDTISIRRQALKRLQAEWNSRGTGWQVEEIGSPIPGWTTVILYYGSSVYDSRQMSDLIDSLVQDAKALGIETKSPEEISSLLKGV